MDGVLFTSHPTRQRANWWRRIARKSNLMYLGLFSHSCVIRIAGLSNRHLTVTGTALTLTSSLRGRRPRRGQIEDYWSSGNRPYGTVCWSASTSFIYRGRGNETHRPSTAMLCLCLSPYLRLANPITLMFSGANFHYLEALMAAWLGTEGAEGELNSRQKQDSLERLRPHQSQDCFPRPQYTEHCASLWNKAVRYSGYEHRYCDK